MTASPTIIRIGTPGPTGPAPRSYTTAAFVQPAVDATVTVDVTSTAWMGAGQPVYISTGGGYVVAAVNSLTSVTLQNIDDDSSASPGTTIPANSSVVVAGLSASEPSSLLLSWANTQNFFLISGTRDANSALTSADIQWPDGATGEFTADVLSTDFPGAIDAWHATYVVGAVTKTVTQSAVTRDSNGAVTAQPVITIS